MSNMTHGTNGTNKQGDSEPSAPPRPASSHGSTSSSGSSKHVRCIGRYVITGSLGKGNFARVEAAVHTLTRAKVAIKIIETDKIKEDYVRKNLLREAQLMRRLRHPNIIRLYETMKTNNLYCLVTEIAEGGELLSHVRSDFKEKRLSEATTRPFIRQLVSALYHLHSVGIVHRDLKMENILLDKRKRQVKIVDFGLSNAAKPGSLLQTHCGSPEYAAPELFIPGREYGPEVDVWSLGVNMYAMLMGKLPFRSPRQGTKRRQKLLEQISGGLAESHEREMEHISKGAKNLIYRLLQPDPQRRTGLDEVMVHPWVTKEGTQPLHPFKYVPPDTATQLTVIDLMSTVLEVNATEIKETVRRDRCDWLAAIYNLLIDQPEGRTILQRLIMDDPEEQLVDAAHYQGSMEHLRLSQGDNLDSYPPDVATMLYNATAHMRKRQGNHRYSLSQPHPQSESGDYAASTLPLTRREKHRHASQELHPLSGPRTLGPMAHPAYTMRRASISSPMSSPEHQPFLLAQQLQQLSRNMHHPQPHPQGDYYIHPPPQHPGSHYSSGGGGRHAHKHAHHKSGGKRMLPVTPSEEPYHQQHQLPEALLRPHSRAESAPDHPLPTPWRPTLAPRNQLVPSSPQPITPTTPTSPGGNPFSSNEELEKHGYPPHPHHQPPGGFKEPLMAPPPQGGIKSTSKKKLSPLRPKSVSLGGGMQKSGGQLSKSIDGLNMKGGMLEQPGSHTISGVTWAQHQQKVGPLSKKRNSLQGWSSVHRLGQPADIQALMQSGHGLPSASYNNIAHHHRLDTGGAGYPGNQGVGGGDHGSVTSMDINQELFVLQSHSNNASPIGSKGSSPQGPSPQASNTHFRSASEREGSLPPPPRELPSSSQKQRRLQHPLPSHHTQLRTTSAKPAKKRELSHHLAQEHSTSMEYVGMAGQRGHTYQNELPQLEDKVNGPRTSGIPVPGFVGKAFKPKNSLKEKSASMNLHPRPA